MPLPWLSIIDGVLGATDIVRWASGRSRSVASMERGSSHIEARLAGVVVSALKEAFDRDHQRLEFERQRLADEQERADRLLRMEWLRQAGDREIARLRLVAGVAVAACLGTLLLVTRLSGGGWPVKTTFGVGWTLLLAALGAAFGAQAHVSRALADVDSRSTVAEITKSNGGVAVWLIVAGLALIAAAVFST